MSCICINLCSLNISKFWLFSSGHYFISFHFKRQKRWYAFLWNWRYATIPKCWRQFLGDFTQSMSEKGSKKPTKKHLFFDVSWVDLFDSICDFFHSFRLNSCCFMLFYEFSKMVFLWNFHLLSAQTFLYFKTNICLNIYMQYCYTSREFPFCL